MIVVRHEEEAALAYVVDDGPGKPLKAKLCVYARRGLRPGVGQEIAATFGFEHPRPASEAHVAGAAEIALREGLGYLEEHREVIEALR